MPRNRMIKPSFWEDEKLATISRDARLTYIAMWNFSDDYGVIKGHYNWLKNTIYPYECNLTIEEFVIWLKELEELSRILRFKHNGERYFYLPKFLEHQQINRPSKQKYPAPPCEILGDSLNTHDVLMDEVKEKEKYNINSQNFLKFWNEYPNKKNKKGSKKIWDALIKKNELPDIENVLNAVKQQKAEKEYLLSQNKFCPDWKHPTTWLNNGCWDDEVNIELPKPPKITTAEDIDREVYGQ